MGSGCGGYECGDERYDAGEGDVFVWGLRHPLVSLRGAECKQEEYALWEFGAFRN